MSKESVKSPSPDVPSKKFGTFMGVYTPSVLTILGVMMYLRFGWVLGNLGLPATLLLVVLASSITFITALSASSIATNMRVGVGGEYFMISRSLGLELGGAIGIPLFLCRTLSLTLYSFGLAESIGFLWPTAWGEVPVQALAAVTIILTTAVSGKSAELSLKLQLPIMIAVGLSVLALAIGVFSSGLQAPELETNYQRSAPEGFWFVFAVFFPAVSGFTAGIGMSGDLKDSRRSIPKGTMLAVFTGVIVYLAIPILLSVNTSVSGEEFSVLDPNAAPIWTKIAFLGFWFVFPGMWGAILSSAFGSALGGPRVLQALSMDGLVPKFLSRTSKTGQPTIATWVTGGIALAAVALGDLNAVGRWVTIFFLTLYVTINLSAAIERIVGDPSYRPTINVPWYVSLVGSAGAVAVMFLISPWVCAAAVVLELILYLILRRRAIKSTWGDARAGLWTAIARFSMLKLHSAKEQARNWRPNILVFTARPVSNIGLTRMANWFSQNRGIVSVCQVIEGDLETLKLDVRSRRRDMETALLSEGVVAFSEVNVVPQFESGIIGIAQAHGLGGLESNTVMFEWPRKQEGLARVLRVMRAVSNINLSTIITKLPEVSGPNEFEEIDVWWRGKQNNGDMLLLLAHLLSLNPQWRQSKVFLRSIVNSEKERQEMDKSLAALISDVRISAKAHVIVKPEEKTIEQTMYEASRKADVVFLGLMIPQAGQEEEYAQRLSTLAEGFHSVVFVRNSSAFTGELI